MAFSNRNPRRRVRRPRHLAPLGVSFEPLEDRRMLALNPNLGLDQTDALEAALVSFQGADLVGKDGPTARIGFDLTLLFEEHKLHQERHPDTPFSPSSDVPLVISGDKVLVELTGAGDIGAFKNLLAVVGMTDIVSSGSLVNGSIPIGNLKQLAGLDALRLARPSYQPIVRAGSVNGQGDPALRADLARAGFGVDGSGVTVGVLSDSFDSVPYFPNIDAVSQDILTGDLPAQTQILQDSFGTDEGRAMAQLIHDVAPGAAIQFATANGGQANFARNILNLAAAGSNVIVDDAGNLAEPFFQDGVIAQAANAVFAQGVPYFSAAGNSGDSSYESAFVDSGTTINIGSRLHDFDPGAAVETLQQLTIGVNSQFFASFQWDQPFASLGGFGSLSDVDISIIGADRTTLLSRGFTGNIGGDPVEVFGFVNDGSLDLDNDMQPDTTFFVRIELFSGPAPGLMKYVEFTGGASIDTFDTNSSTNIGHPNTSGSMGVAASAFFLTPTFGTTPPQLNDFSSKGGTLILFDTGGNRLAAPFNPNSPQVTGVDGANTTFFGSDVTQDADSFPNFFGTSAAAPHVAAVAALMIDLSSALGGISPSDIYSGLMSTAIDIVQRVDPFNPGTPVAIPGGQGFDAFSGRGLVNAVAALQVASSRLAIGNDVAIFEGDAGTTDMVFSISYVGTIVQAITVFYTTVDSTAVAPEDYQAKSGTLTFQVGGTKTQLVTIKAVGDLVVEPNEAFFVQLSNPTGTILGRNLAVGRILNDDVELSINDVTVIEGDSLTKDAVFDVSAFGVTDRVITLNYTTLDNTAIAGIDYLARGGNLTFPSGASLARITVPVIGDKRNEADETFQVLLSGVQNARIVDNLGIGTIRDNDPLPNFYVNDVQLTTTAAGVLAAVFSVALDTASGRDVTVGFSTADGAAKDGVDYVGLAGLLTFPPGITTRLVSVPVLTHDNYSANKKFFLGLSNPLNALLADAQGIGTIVFADGPGEEFIIDNGSVDFSQTGGWTNVTNTLAYQLDYDYHTGGNGSATSTWKFEDIPSGSYQVFARWSWFVNWATNAPFTILDETTPLGTVTVNQQLPPAGEVSNGVTWQSLGTFQINTNTLAVRLGNNANGYVIADAIRIVSGGIAPQVPEMDVAGFDQSISHGDDTPTFEDATDFGQVASVSGSTVRTFTITNNGNSDLHLLGNPQVIVTGINVADFTVVRQPSSVVQPGKKTTFDLVFHPLTAGPRVAGLSIANDDDSEHPYTFDIKGMGTAAGPSQFIIDDGQSGFTQFGDWSTATNLTAYQSQMRTAAAGQGSEKAVWNFFGLAPGTYDVFATWVGFVNRASNAPFTVSNLADHTFTTLVNQQQSPSILMGSTHWGSLGTIDVTNGSLRVTLANNANGFVVADAVTIVRRGIAPAALPFAHNASLPQDVNGDNRVSLQDALILINNLAMQSAAPDAAPSAAPAAAPLATTSSDGGAPSAAPLAATGGEATVSNYYLDVYADGRVTLRDVLMVINYLLAPHPAAPAAAPQASTSSDDPPVLAAAAVDEVIVLFDDISSEVVAGASSPPAIPAAGKETSAASESAPSLLLPDDFDTLLIFGDADESGDDEIDPLLAALGH
jgi:hypothetical protein